MGIFETVDVRSIILLYNAKDRNFIVVKISQIKKMKMKF